MTLDDDPYTMDLRLCDDNGLVSDEPVDGKDGNRSYLYQLNVMKPADRQWTGGAFACTGHAHLAGEHIRCTSPAHPGTP